MSGLCSRARPALEPVGTSQPACPRGGPCAPGPRRRHPRRRSARPMSRRPKPRTSPRSPAPTRSPHRPSPRRHKPRVRENRAPPGRHLGFVHVPYVVRSPISSATTPTVAAVQASGALTASNVTEELIGKTAWVCEREEMAAWKLVDGEMQSLLCDATLELDREEAIAASGDHVDGDGGRRPA